MIGCAIPVSITLTELSVEQQLAAELQTDRTLQIKYNDLAPVKFWLLARNPVITVDAVNILFHFSTTYLYELGF